MWIGPQKFGEYVDFPQEDRQRQFQVATFANYVVPKFRTSYPPAPAFWPMLEGGF